MKKKFEIPVVNIRAFHPENIITASGTELPKTASQKAQESLADTGVNQFIYLEKVTTTD